MNKEHTIVVVGGGYGGINLIKELQKQLNIGIKIILVDKNSYHFKKVKLFKAIVEEGEANLKVPLTKYCKSNIDFIQGELKSIHQSKIEIKDNNDQIKEIAFNQLVLTLGSVIQEMDVEYGGKSLSSLQNAKIIREDLLMKIHSRKTSLKVAVVGGGITGIETSAELASWLKSEAQKAGMSPSNVEVLLLNDKDRLLTYAPIKVGTQLENKLKSLGVKTSHNRKVIKFSEGKVDFLDGSHCAADYCIWTVGIKAHPSLKGLGLPLQDNGKIKTDSWYRIETKKNMYAIGDCAHVIDSISGDIAGMTCKEAINQAKALSKIIEADLRGTTADSHKSFPNLHCIGLGPEEGYVWMKKWGINFILSGKLGAKIRDYTWNIASLID